MRRAPFPAANQCHQWAMRILVIEDHKKIAGFIESGLERKGFATGVCRSGEAGFFNARMETAPASPMKSRRTFSIPSCAVTPRGTTRFAAAASG